MSCITIDSGTRRLPDLHNGGAERRPGIVANLLRAALRLVSACRSAAALAMMSERDLDDLGLLPWEVRSEMDRGTDSRAATRRPETLAHRNQA